MENPTEYMAQTLQQVSTKRFVELQMHVTPRNTVHALRVNGTQVKYHIIFLTIY